MAVKVATFELISAAVFASLGAKVLYADQVAKDIIDTHDDVKRRVRKEFGNEIYLPNGTLDRKRMARTIFLDASLREKLEQIVHPYVLQVFEEKIQFFRQSSTHGLFIVEAALHYESGAEELFDYMIVIDAGEKQRFDRTMRRDGVTRHEITQRMQAQMPSKEKAAQADFVIHNNGDRDALKEKCVFVFRILESIANSSSGSEQ